MEYRHLGKYGVRVSEVALGSWLTYGGVTEDDTATRCIEKAYEGPSFSVDTGSSNSQGHD